MRRRQAKRWLACRVRIVVLEVEIYGRVESESLRAEIEHEDTQSSGCLAAEARVAIGTCHLLADPVRPNSIPDWPKRPSPTVAVRQ